MGRAVDDVASFELLKFFKRYKPAAESSDDVPPPCGVLTLLSVTERDSKGLLISHLGTVELGTVKFPVRTGWQHRPCIHAWDPSRSPRDFDAPQLGASVPALLGFAVRKLTVQARIQMLP